MVDYLISDSDVLIKRAKEYETAFSEAWVERGTELNDAGAIHAAKQAHELAKDAKGVSMILEDTLEANKSLLEQDKKLDVEYDKIKEKEKKEKMYA